MGNRYYTPDGSFRFPRPGERHNPMAIPVAPRVLAGFLYSQARDLSSMICVVEECANCVLTRRAWWDHYEALPGNLRAELYRRMKDMGVPFPAYDDLDLEPIDTLEEDR